MQSKLLHINKAFSIQNILCTVLVHKTTQKYVYRDFSLFGRNKFTALLITNHCN